MKIGIIGAGNIGRVLALRWVEKGHEVLIGNSRGPDTLAEVAGETGAKPAELADVVRGAAVIVVTIPEKKVLNLPAGLFDDVPETTVVIDTGNYYPRERDGRIEEIESGMMESAWVAQQIGRPVIKAFNNIYAAHLRDLGKPEGTPGRVALPVSGDNADAKTVVMQLVNEMGFDPVDNGGIDDSWRQQPGTPVYTKDFDKEALKAHLQKAERDRKPQWSATDKSPGSFDHPA
ncbi:NADP oxidoreductase coenzyme F420-dependent (plasmid) [Caballeronia sp. SBC1]|uniref:NADPH-dependent F420 reductase n=1 Tax=unclassified Caballeronia TaxID=2646786 RepID=UPI0013E131FF|nr:MULTISPECIES: NAD(P)-binding domain-containing protein [unclassified Caballeronia]QIE28563.1 NADP oxidoreductase coenzyme F420-dependent [Caballeronia sp. SBC2]QIN66618.1 NADP oxidoreductase coenzyme F420-dependent [Caballeronia sp. SBC1]